MTSDDYIRFLDRTSTRPGERHHGLGLLELRPQHRCLDLGCGVGEDARAMSEVFGAQVVGIDLSPRMVKEAMSRSVGGPSATFLVADAGRLPFVHSASDAAWVKRTLMHVASPASVFGEMVRVVRPGGRIVAVEPDMEGVFLDSGMVDVTRKTARVARRRLRESAGREAASPLDVGGRARRRACFGGAEIAQLAAAEGTLRLLSLARSAVGKGILTSNEAAMWEEDLKARDDRGLFACYALMFVADGRTRDP